MKDERIKTCRYCKRDLIVTLKRILKELVAIRKINEKVLESLTIR